MTDSLWRKRQQPVKRLTKEQAAIIGCFTGIACGPFSDVHAKAEQIMNRPIFTHEFANKDFWKDLRENVKQEFMDICFVEEQTKDKT